MPGFAMATPIPVPVPMERAGNDRGHSIDWPISVGAFRRTSLELFQPRENRSEEVSDPASGFGRKVDDPRMRHLADLNIRLMPDPLLDLFEPPRKSA